MLAKIVAAALALIPMEKIMSETVEKESITIIGIACKTSNAVDAASVDIPKLWQRFYAEGTALAIPNKISHDVIALYCDYEGDFTKPYSLVIGCPVSSKETIPEGMVAKIIPGGTYERFLATGEFPASVVKTWNTIWTADLKRTYTGDYERYGEAFSSGTSKDVEVFVAVNN